MSDQEDDEPQSELQQSWPIPRISNPREIVGIRTANNTVVQGEAANRIHQEMIEARRTQMQEEDDSFMNLARTVINTPNSDSAPLNENLPRMADEIRRQIRLDQNNGFMNRISRSLSHEVANPESARQTVGFVMPQQTTQTMYAVGSGGNGLSVSRDRIEPGRFTRTLENPFLPNPELVQGIERMGRDFDGDGPVDMSREYLHQLRRQAITDGPSPVQSMFRPVSIGSSHSESVTKEATPLYAHNLIQMLKDNLDLKMTSHVSDGIIEITVSLIESTDGTEICSDSVSIEIPK